jgi:hypothetical protein
LDAPTICRRGQSGPFATPCDERIEIPVTPLDDKGRSKQLAQLDENKKRKRNREHGHVWLLQVFDALSAARLRLLRKCRARFAAFTIQRTSCAITSWFDGRMASLKAMWNGLSTCAHGYRFHDEAVCDNAPT